MRDTRTREDLKKGITGPGGRDRVFVSGKKAAASKKEGAAFTTPRGIHWKLNSMRGQRHLCLLSFVMQHIRSHLGLVMEGTNDSECE